MNILIIVILIVPTLILFLLILFLLIKGSRDLFLAIFFQQKKPKNNHRPPFVKEKQILKNYSNKSNTDFLDFSGGRWGI